MDCNKIDSKIIGSDSVGQEQLRFIQQALGRPATMKLLFRASEHGFSAKEFHRWCDGKAPTLVVVRTNFGKTLGGYTPVPWKSVGGDGE